LSKNSTKYFSIQETPSLSPSPYQNGFNGLHNPYQHILQQKQLEEQFRNLGLKQQNFSGAQTVNITLSHSIDRVNCWFVLDGIPEWNFRLLKWGYVVVEWRCSQHIFETPG